MKMWVCGSDAEFIFGYVPVEVVVGAEMGFLVEKKLKKHPFFESKKNETTD